MGRTKSVMMTLKFRDDDCRTSWLALGRIRSLMPAAFIVFLPVTSARAQTLEQELKLVPLTVLADQARIDGNAARGASVFFQPSLACTNCHSLGRKNLSMPGPDLTTIHQQTPDVILVESVLEPSKKIRPGYETVTVTTTSGKTMVGRFAAKTDDAIILRDVARTGDTLTVTKSEIDEYVENSVSLMPSGQVNQLTSRQQFLDLIRYLMELRDGGEVRAMELHPPAMP